METAPATGPVEVTGPDLIEVDSFLDDLCISPGANLIGILQESQERFGYLPANVLTAIAQRMRTPLSRIYGVVTFYADFKLSPQGKHKVRVCRGTACHVNGALKVVDCVERVLRISDGESTPDLQFCLETVACLGTCFLAPVMMIDDQYFGQLTSQKVEKIIQSYQSERQ